MVFDRKVEMTVLVFVLLGCGNSNGIFRQDGFYNDRHPYRVSYPQARSLLAGSGWVVDNYERDGAEIGDEKDSLRYRAFARIDQDEDGVPDANLAFPAYDLLLRNVKHAGRIWIRTLPLPPELQNTELRVLSLDFIDAVSASGRITATEINADPSYSGGLRMVTRMVERYDARLDSERAYEVTFDSADVDQARFADDGRHRRTRMIVLRPDFDFFDGRKRFPLLMLIGYTNRVEDFARGNADFERLVSGIDILSEPELVRSRTAALLECAGDHAKRVTVYVDIDKRGEIEWADTQEQRKAEFDALPAYSCAQQALVHLRFRDTGQRRRLTVVVERGRPALRARGYARVEHGQPAAVASVTHHRVISSLPPRVRVTQELPPTAPAAAPAPAPVPTAAVAALPAAALAPAPAAAPATDPAPSPAATPPAAAPAAAAPAPVATPQPESAPAEKPAPEASTPATPK